MPNTLHADESHRRADVDDTKAGGDIADIEQFARWQSSVASRWRFAAPELAHSFDTASPNIRLMKSMLPPLRGCSDTELIARYDALALANDLGSPAHTATC